MGKLSWLKMLRTALPICIGEDFGRTLGQAWTGIGYDQQHAVEPTLLEVCEEGAPASPVFLGAFADAKNLPVTLAVHTDRDKQLADLVAGLELNAVQVNVTMTAFDRPIAPGLDRPVNFLVQLRAGRWRHPRAPRPRSNILDKAP